MFTFNIGIPALWILAIVTIVGGIALAFFALLLFVLALIWKFIKNKYQLPNILEKGEEKRLSLAIFIYISTSWLLIYLYSMVVTLMNIEDSSLGFNALLLALFVTLISFSIYLYGNFFPIIKRYKYILLNNEGINDKSN